MQDDSKREERGNRCGGILKGSRDAHTHINTHTHARSLSPLACCAAVTDQTYLSLCVLFLCTFGRQIPSPFGKLLTVLPCTVQCQHSVFSCACTVQVCTGLCEFRERIGKENKTLTERLGHKPAYITQCISFRERFGARIIFRLCVSSLVGTLTQNGGQAHQQEMVSERV